MRSSFDIQAARQVFRRHEIYSLRVQALLLLLPPGLVAVHATYGQEHTWAFGSVFRASLSIYLPALLAFTVVYRLSPWHPLAC